MEVEQETVVDCTVQFQVDNHEFVGEESTFDLYLAKSGNLEKQKESNSFSYRVTEKNERSSFSQVFELEKGSHELHLFGKVGTGTIKFSLITVQCFLFAKYPRIQEYEKGNW